ncbi:MAG: FAD-dependent oxidoreductase [Acidobacteria bacterium]|nr:FAD-dependent oxidoreductase [Acidobacteriota bacterium]
MLQNKPVIQLETGFCVVGGGIAGVCAALAAARRGAKVVLVQDRSVLGGNASSEVRMHIVGASCSGRRPGARESGIIEELRVEDAVRNPHRSPHLFDLLLYDKIVSEPNITLLLDTSFVNCRVAGGRVESIRAVRPNTADDFLITAPYYADCSGDSHLGVAAGATWRMGREARDEFHEPHGQESADTKVLGSTILFMASRKDRPVPFRAPAWARKFTEKDLSLRSHREWEYGYWWAEWGGELDTVHGNPRIRHELLRIALGVWDHIKNDCPRAADDPTAAYEKWMDGEAPPRTSEGPENWSLDWVGMLPGKRESRRILGHHVLTENDVVSGRLFDDAVGYGGWWIDVHPPAGIDAVHEYPTAQIEVAYLYSIPLRSLISRDIVNLFLAGRNISATHLAFASTRVMATCGVMGQAIGTAAAHAAAVPLCDMTAAQHIRAIQQMLAEDDAFLLQPPAPRDLARESRITASSEAAGYSCAHIASAFTRATSPALHPSLPDSPNQWRSTALPAWIELRWPAAVAIREIDLIFDTGFERELTLSMSDAYTAKMIRAPQPETVSHYKLTANRAVIAEVTDSFQRLCRHKFQQPLLTDHLRLDVLATHGVPEARVFAVRVR